MRKSLLSLALVAFPVASAAEPPAVTLGGYLQPQARIRQDDDVAQFDEDGLRVRRARLTAAATQEVGVVEVSTHLELELTPEFSLLDGYLSATSCLPGEGTWRIDAGQVKAPVSRQTLLSDSRLGFVEKAELASLAPDRQIGILGRIEVPHLPEVRVSAGMFDGEGRNQGQNIDENFLFAGRVEYVPIGRAVPLAESAHDGDYVAIGVSVAHNRLDIGDGLENRLFLGADLAFAFHGASGSVEYLQVDYDFAEGSVQMPYRGNGLVAQAAYLLPTLGEQLEVGARFQELDRNDTVPIERAGDSNQSQRYITGALGWYPRGHTLKVQLEASHITEIEDLDRNFMDATYANDQVLVQATYRME